MLKIIIFTLGSLLAVHSSWAVQVYIPNGTLVVVKTTEELEGNKLRDGQAVTSVVVAMPVKIGELTMIKAGTPVACMVQSSESNGMVGQAGKLLVNIQSTTSVDGSMIPLTGTIGNKGESEMGGTVAASVILCPLFLLNKGDVASVP